MSLGFSDRTWQQLELWKQRTLAVCSVDLALPVHTKQFKSKNGLPKLGDYRETPDGEFWTQFPVNLVYKKDALISAIKLRRLAEQCGFADKAALDTVCKDLSTGAEIGCTGQCRRATRSDNSASSLAAGEQVTDAIASGVKKGFIFGPVELSEIPLNAKVNGIMCRPKPDGSVRVILNMSAPKGCSVNDGIDADLFPAKMSSTQKWLAVLNKAGHGCYIMKMDWSDAYKHIPVAQEDIKLQWFTWLGKAFAELCLIFGTSSSVGIYDRAAKVVLELALRVSKFPRDLVCQHLDDVCAAAPADGTALVQFGQTYRKVAAQIGVQLAPTDNPEKAFDTCQEGVVLGVHYNTADWSWMVPDDKLARLVNQIRDLLALETAEQGEIWSLCGRILHYAPLVPAGRFNLDHIIKANSFSTEKKTPVPITAELRRQVRFWQVLLQVSSGHSRIPEVPSSMPVWTRECYTDAAGGSLDGPGRGCGAVSESWWAYWPWPRKINCGVKAADGKKLSRKLSALELVAPLICLAAGSEWCRNKPVRIWVDNFGSVRIWKKGYSTHCQLCNTLVKAIASVAAGIGCKLEIEKITRCSSPGAIMADQLSKADHDGFRRSALAASWALEVAPATIPTTVLQWINDPVVDDDLGEKILKELASSVQVLGYSWR